MKRMNDRLHRPGQHRRSLFNKGLPASRLGAAYFRSAVHASVSATNNPGLTIYSGRSSSTRHVNSRRMSAACIADSIDELC